MKSLTISQRLYVFYGLVMLALAGGFRLFIYADHLEDVAVEQREQIETNAALIRFDALQISDALRALLLDPNNQSERQRRIAADAHLAKTIDALKAAFKDRPELQQAAEDIRELESKRLNTTEARLLELIARDREAANAFFNGTYLPVRREQRGQFLDGRGLFGYPLQAGV